MADNQTTNTQQGVLKEKEEQDKKALKEDLPNFNPEYYNLTNEQIADLIAREGTIDSTKNK